MSWEDVDALPGAAQGGAFRGSAEPVVAERVGLRPAERLRLFWHSDPDHPLNRTAERVAVTSQYVYVARRDGTKARVPLERLHGERLDRGRVIYGVKDGDDLLLPYRDRCAVQVRLAAAVRGEDPVEPWRDAQHVATSVVFGLAALSGSGVLLLLYPLGEALAHVEAGLYTAESVLGSLGGFAAALAGVFILLWAPSRWRIDAVAVTRTRGVVPWLSFSVPPERFRRATITKAWVKPKNGPRRHVGWFVGLEPRAPIRIGSLAKVKNLHLRLERFSSKPAAGPSATLKQARAFAERLRKLLSLEATLERG